MFSTSKNHRFTNTLKFKNAEQRFPLKSVACAKTKKSVGPMIP